MKCLRFVLPAVMLLILTAPVFAQTDAQKSFDTLKTLAGNWEGPVTLNPPQADMDPAKPVHVSLRVTSRETRLCTKCRKRERRWTRKSTTIRSR